MPSKNHLIEIRDNNEKEENSNKAPQVDSSQKIEEQQIKVQSNISPQKPKHAHLINMQEIEEQVEEEEKDSPKKGNGQIEVEEFDKSEDQSHKGNFIFKQNKFLHNFEIVLYFRVMKRVRVSERIC